MGQSEHRELVPQEAGGCRRGQRALRAGRAMKVPYPFQEQDQGKNKDQTAVGAMGGARCTCTEEALGDCWVCGWPFLAPAAQMLSRASLKGQESCAEAEG